MSLLPITAYAENDVIGEVKAFFAEHGRDHDGRGHVFYRADMKGGGTFNIELDEKNKTILCWLADSQTDGDSFYKYEFVLRLKPPFDSDITWSCVINDENGINIAYGKMAPYDNVNFELVCDEYTGDEYLRKSFMENAHNFRDALILAIANDLNYYFDKNLDYFGLNPYFFCVDGHSFGEWVYQKNATKQANGTEKRTCNNCFATEEREVEGTMIVVPEGTVEQTPAPEVVPQKQPEKAPEKEPEVVPQPESPEKAPQTEQPDYQFELETPQTDGDDKEDKPKKAMPPYAIPLGIALAVVVAATVVVLVAKTKQGGKQTDDNDDLFKM